MLKNEDIQRIRDLISRHTHVQLPETDVTEGTGLRVILENGRAVIAAEDRNALARGFLLLAQAVKDGQDELHISQSRHFASCGVMADVSRNAVLTVPAVKRLLDRLAMLGMNLLMLYTEDTYTVHGYPYFGYLRGRYSPEELREIDDYAAALDIELVPCIQTLGHMEQFLGWEDSRPLRDTSDILQCDLPETYELLDAAIGSLRSSMRARRIHIGMDEAHGVGLGRYHEKHGETDRFALLNRHLEKVCGICRKYDFHPMMWSDMFFRLGSKTLDYYDPEAVIPQSVIDTIPDVDLCYWDYYHKNEQFYEHMLEQHARLGTTVFAGGIWVWAGFLPHVKRTEATMGPALRACARQEVDTVFATMWGDDGAETNLFLALNQLPIFSEACWQGEDADPESLRKLGEIVSGIPDEAYRQFGEFFHSEREHCTGKALIWGDLLYPLTNNGFEAPADAAARFRQADDKLTPYSSMLECRYAQLCFQTAALKGEVIQQLRQRYLAGDRAYLIEVASQTIDALLGLYRQLMQTHRTLWERDMKRFGWEVLALRYGAVMGRLMDVQDEIQRYLSGTLPAIPELEEEPLPAGRCCGQHFRTFVTPTTSIW